MRAASAPHLLSLLKQVFGFAEFRPHQEQIILETLAGRDIFAALPTGGGKSLCYQLPSLVRSGLTIVISPLIALMKDQVDSAKAAGVEAACLNSSISPAERHEVYSALATGALKLLYIAPERLAMDGALEELTAWNCTAVAIDEAHCISEWGHDFRPDYRQLKRIREQYPNIPITALTATATRRVQDDVITQLGLKNPYTIRASFNRPEIFYRVEPKRDALTRIASFVKARASLSGIIYRATRADVEATATYLQKQGIGAACYHAGLSDETRRQHQDDFKADRIPVIVATIAFGMGIDKPDIRYVIHGDLPKSLESYYQETGRAGRDGENAETLLLWSIGDLAKTRWHIRQLDDSGEQERAGKALQSMLRFADTFACRRRILLAHFNEEHPGNCGSCDVCTGEVESIEATEDARKFLSAAIRTHQQYGAHYLADIVKGTLSDKIRDKGHQNLPTFGVGADMTKKHWLAIANDLEAAGFTYRDEERYKAVTITQEGMELLYGRREFRTVRRAKDSKEKLHAAAYRLPLAPNGQERELSEEDKKLFEALRALRFNKAKEIGKPPYIIFPNRTLIAMAVFRPRTQEELLACPGVGEKKLEAWGKLFLNEINAFLEQ
ncbi:MAG: DNA helicase RecQ [Spirochaeta sp. LUC14_002_19_P3]|nr:MAG: DNA helicase RecQ [Spirochaeta sp. LUC14_002_19_P3]